MRLACASEHIEHIFKQDSNLRTKHTVLSEAKHIRSTIDKHKQMLADHVS